MGAQSLLALLFVSSCAKAPPTLEVWARVQPMQGASLGVVHLRDCQLLPSGLELRPDHAVTGDWVVLPLDSREVSGRWVRVASGALPPRSYTHVFLRARSVEGEEPITKVLEPLAAPFVAAPGDTLRMDLSIAIVPLAGASGGALAAMKGARVRRL